MTPVGIGVFGLTGDGKGLARAFGDLPGADLRWIGDRGARPSPRTALPHTRVTNEFEELLDDGAVEAVVVATQATADRAALARRALEADKHVLVAEPHAASRAEALALLRLAARRRRSLLVGNPLLFHPAVRKLRELIELGKLGPVSHLRAERRHLAADASAQTLAAGVLSLVLYLLGEDPVAVDTWADRCDDPAGPDVLDGRLHFASGTSAHLHASRVDPRPADRIAVVGARRTAVFDRLDRERELTIYDGGRATRRRWRDGSARSGDIFSPRVDGGDALRLECEHFLALIRDGVAEGDGLHAVGVVTALGRLAEALSSVPAEPAAEAERARVILLPVRGGGR